MNRKLFVSLPALLAVLAFAAMPVAAQATTAVPITGGGVGTGVTGLYSGAVTGGTWVSFVSSGSDYTNPAEKYYIYTATFPGLTTAEREGCGEKVNLTVKMWADNTASVFLNSERLGGLVHAPPNEPTDHKNFDHPNFGPGGESPATGWEFEAKGPGKFQLSPGSNVLKFVVLDESNPYTGVDFSATLTPCAGSTRQVVASNEATEICVNPTEPGGGYSTSPLTYAPLDEETFIPNTGCAGPTGPTGPSNEQYYLERPILCYTNPENKLEPLTANGFNFGPSQSKVSFDSKAGHLLCKPLQQEGGGGEGVAFPATLSGSLKTMGYKASEIVVAKSGHYYKNSFPAGKLAEGERMPTISWGTLTFTPGLPSKAAPVTCESATGGFAENPAGGGAGAGAALKFSAWNCADAECPAGVVELPGGKKVEKEFVGFAGPEVPSVDSPGTATFAGGSLPWPTVLTESEVGQVRSESQHVVLEFACGAKKTPG